MTAAGGRPHRAAGRQVGRREGLADDRKHAVQVVDLAPCGFFYPKALNRRHANHGLPGHLARDSRSASWMVTTSTGPQASSKAAPVRVAGVAQGVRGLDKNGVARHQPKDNRPLGMQKIPHRYSRGVAGEQRLAAAGRTRRQT